MKICLISNLYGDNARGGAERVVQAEAAALAAAGHQVTVIAGSAAAGRDDGSADPQAPGVKVVRYRPANIFFYSDAGRHGFFVRLVWHLLDIFNRSSARRLTELLRRESPDVVHTHNLMGLGFLAPRAIRKLKIRHIHTLHDVQLLHPSGLLDAAALRRPGPAARVYIALMKRLFGSPAVVISPSRFLLDRHRERGFFKNSAAAVLPNPAPTSAEASVGRPPGSPVFLFVGQVEEHKGIRFLLDAWAEWPGSARAVLEIAGDGARGDELRELTKDAPGIRWLGRLEGEALRQAYDRASYAVLPSLVIENHPTVIGESFSRGTPVIAAASGGIPELVADGVDGFLFAPGDRAGLIAALDRAEKEAPAWPARSAAAREKAAGLGIDRHLAELLRTYRGE